MASTTLRESMTILDNQIGMDFRRRALQKILPPLISGQDVLDAGSGMGFMTRTLAAMGYEVTAIDTEHDFVTTTVCATERAMRPAYGVTYAGGTLPFIANSFDTAVSLDVIEHVEDDSALLRELNRVLRPGGRLVLTVPALSWAYGQRDRDIGHYRRYDKEFLQQRFNETGFEVKRLSYWNMLGVAPYVISEHVLHRPVPDIRQRRPTPARRMIASLLSWWLTQEQHLSLPLGLSLLAVVHKTDQHVNDREHA